jgi:hypothetical protein
VQWVHGRQTGCILPAAAPREAPFRHLAPQTGPPAPICWERALIHTEGGRGPGGLCWSHPGASPSIGPWGIPLAAPSRVPSTNALFGDLMGQSHSRRVLRQAGARRRGPSGSQYFNSYTPKSFAQSSTRGLPDPGHTTKCAQPPWRQRGAAVPTAARLPPPR